ncbi:MAG TPA: DsbA family protein [Bryobacteraceae bacterium]|jgi:protein-disulfide isomerase|nr:DsbA family protein [Bryobacteraceae bacterium]
MFFASLAALLLALSGSAQSQSHKTAEASTPSAAKKSALDKATLEAYVRHLYVMDSHVNIAVHDSEPSDVPGFVNVTVHASVGPQFKDLKFLVSKDGSKILEATVYDVNNNPFKRELSLLQTEGEPALGTKGAPVMLVEFSDFECPYCKQEAEILQKNLLSTYPTQVRLYFKTFPLESLHPWSKVAAIAGKCVAKQNNDAFWAYHDWIFEHQAEVTPETFHDKTLGWAKDEKDLDSLKLGQCMDTKATEAEVNEEELQGQKLEVNATPTLFVNGRRMINSEWPALKSVIDYELNYQKTAHDAGDDCGCTLDLKLPGMPAQSSTPVKHEK